MTSVLRPDRAPQPPVGPGPVRRWAVLAAAVAVLVGAVPVVSYVRALTYPGDAPFAVRTVEWVRDHGGGGLVDLVENWWYARPPEAAAPDPATLPAPAAVAAPVAALPPALPVLPGLAPLPGEGAWTAGRVGRGGRPVLLTSFVRPDPRHPSVVAGIARLDTTAVRLALIAGTTQPDTLTPSKRAQVPGADRAALVATFNSGWKIADAHGGAVLDGRTAAVLRGGAASVVVRRDGSAVLGAWGRDVGPGPDVLAVRQNLDLVVDGGRAVDGLDTNSDLRWGSTKNQLQYTWRSGLGVDAAGNLLYVAGAQLDLTTLAATLVRAGAVRGMELDIHNNMVDFFGYPHGAAGGAVKLLPAMPGPATRYLVPDQRDFFAVTLR